MGDEKDNLDAHQELDLRIREVEISHSSLSSTIVNMNLNITEMKQMFQKFMLDSERITELAGKIESITRLEKETIAINNKYDEMFRKLILLEHTCSTCQIGKVDGYIKDMSEKVSKIETKLDDMKESRGKFSGFWNTVGQSIVTMVIIYILYMVAMNVQSNGNPLQNAPSIKKSEIVFFGEANAGSFKNNSSVIRR
jgi:uncharacterized coiled-coil protein SlyX